MVGTNIAVNSSSSNVPVISRTQKIIVNPANSSVSVINSGPIGPRGLTGPPDAGSVLTVDGQIMTRSGGVLAPITRPNLAADTAFSVLYQPLNSNLTSIRSGIGAPAGTGTNGDQYYDTAAKRLYRSDGVGWIIMQEPEQTYTPLLVNITLGSPGQQNVGRYTRSNGWVDFDWQVILGTGGTVTGNVSITAPVSISRMNRYAMAVRLLDSGVDNYRGMNEAIAASNVINIYCTGGTSSTGLERASILAASAPFPWTAGDGIIASGRAKMNTPYL